MANDLCWDEILGELHVFKMIKRCVGVEIVDIDSKNFSQGVEIVELNSNLVVVQLAVGVATSHG